VPFRETFEARILGTIRHLMTYGFTFVTDQFARAILHFMSRRLTTETDRRFGTLYSFVARFEALVTLVTGTGIQINGTIRRLMSRRLTFVTDHLFRTLRSLVAYCQALVTLVTGTGIQITGTIRHLMSRRLTFVTDHVLQITRTLRRFVPHRSAFVTDLFDTFGGLVTNKVAPVTHLAGSDAGSV